MSSTRYSCLILMKLEMFRKVLKNLHNSEFMKMDPVAAELLHAGRHDEANSRFWQFCERALTRALHVSVFAPRHKLHLPYFATNLFIFSSVDGGETGTGINYRGPASGRPNNVAHVFAFSVVPDAVRL
jgi:hypothetical protein